MQYKLGLKYFKNNYGFKILLNISKFPKYFICICISIFSGIKFTIIQASQQNSSYASKNSAQNVLFVNYLFY